MQRMIEDYIERFYEPEAKRFDKISADSFKLAKGNRSMERESGSRMGWREGSRSQHRPRPLAAHQQR